MVQIRRGRDVLFLVMLILLFFLELFFLAEKEKREMFERNGRREKKGECERFAMGKFESGPQATTTRSQNCCIRRELNLQLEIEDAITEGFLFYMR